MDLTVFLDVEKKYKLLDAKIESYNVWIYSRFRIAWAFAKQINNFGGTHSEGNKTELSKLKLYFCMLLNIVKKGRLKKGSVDVLILNHPRRILTDGIYECIYTDKIAELLTKSLVVEGPYQKLHYQPVSTRNLVYTDAVDIKCFWHCVCVQNFRPKRFRSIKDKVRNLLEMPISELNLKLGTKVNLNVLVDEVTYGFFMYEIEKKYYENILKRTHPKLILEMVSYSRSCMIINEWSKEMNIPTIELQHGVMGSEHAAYNYSESHKISQFPDYIFLFSDYWKKSAKFPIPDSNIRSVGFPYLERMVEKYAGNYHMKSNVINILFLSSGPMGKELSRIAYELEQLLDKEHYHIIFKLHPGEYAIWKEKYSFLTNGNIEVIDNNNNNLYEIFSRSDLQVCGFGTTAILEGLSFGLPAYVIKHKQIKEFIDLSTAGFAELFEDAKDLAERIKKRDYKGDSTDMKEAFWKKHALQNIKKEIIQIVGENEIHWND